MGKTAEAPSSGPESEYVVPTPSGVPVTRYQSITCILGLSKIGQGEEEQRDEQDLQLISG